MEIKTFDGNTALVKKLSGRIAAQLRSAINLRGSATLAVSGGSTPITLFEHLSREEMPWENVWVTLVDERWVDERHKDSNARLVRENLLQHHAQTAHFIGLKSDHQNPFEAAEEINVRLNQLTLPFDIVVLGMGGDGHTASFFPSAPTLMDALQPVSGTRCVAIHPPHAPHERMTLTLPTILEAKLVVLHIEGEEKWKVLQQAIIPGPVEALPVRAVLNQEQAVVEIYYAGTDR